MGSWKSSNLEYKIFPPKQFLPQITCTAFVYASNWPTWSTKCFPPNNICSRIYVWYVFKFSQIDSATYVVFPNRFCYICCFLLGMRRLSLMQLMMGAFSGLLVWIVCYNPEKAPINPIDCSDPYVWKIVKVGKCISLFFVKIKKRQSKEEGFGDNWWWWA